MPSIAIIGASSDRNKFGNKAVRIFASKGYQVYPVNPKETYIEGHKVYPSITDVPEMNLDMISVYLPWTVTFKMVKEISEKGCKELWLNPGAESEELVEELERHGLTVIQACSIVGVGSSPSDV
ncbi:MAG: CoA-binding protein [Proteobacteria bacterium]|nr:CoA-binding protein [Pseudomonadota bacterium]NDC23158.1 CoA-binding protein [Pseudomonadota bacterium]NDG26954.1 CoA-binding protein [Pseudomonadota bacterium]